jgi:hypothetical protein
MANWQQLGKENTNYPTQSLTRRQISLMSDQTENRMEPADPDAHQPINCLYPWHDKTRESGRALCLLMIHYICLMSASLTSSPYDMVRVLLLQMVEGLEDRQERDTFMQHYHTKQTKAAITRWKKNKKDKRIRVHLRPILAPHETDLVNLCYRNLPSTEDQAVLLTLVNPSPDEPILYSYYCFS